MNNFTPLTVKRIRCWLLGPSTMNKSLSDFDFIRLLTAVWATPNFRVIDRHVGPYGLGLGYIGYTWDPMDPECSDYKEYVDQSSTDRPHEVSWFEYQARLVTGALRPSDSYYQPYDERKAKTEWGLQKLAITQARRAVGKPDSYIFNPLGLNVGVPGWLVWDKFVEQQNNIWDGDKALDNCPTM